MRSSRLTALLLHLQAVRRATAAELAAELEVSVRTVHRDIAALQAAGVPLWTQTGRAGGVWLLDGWRTRLDGLTGDEAAALVLAGAGGEVLGGLGMAASAAAARTKLLATLPPEPRERAARVRERFHLDAPGWFHRDEAVPHLATVAGAVWSGHRVDVRYARRDREVARRLDPLGLVCKAGVWYLVARHRADVRSYRVARLRHAMVRPEPFERPAGFDLVRWWAASNEDFARTLLRWTCRLRLSPVALTRLRQVVDPLAAREAVAAAGPPDADGWREVEFATEGLQMALSQLCALADGVVVLAPAELRAAFAGVGRRMAENNMAENSAAAAVGSNATVAGDREIGRCR
ncbi:MULTISPECIES: helix-turn-helix transcriptional regulator [unclassified Frankia]